MFWLLKRTVSLILLSTHNICFDREIRKLFWNSFPACGDFVICWFPLQAVWTQIRTDRMSVLIWFQTVWHSDSVPERNFLKSLFWKKSADDNKSKKNFLACKELIILGILDLSFWLVHWSYKLWKYHLHQYLGGPLTLDIICLHDPLLMPIFVPVGAVWSGFILFAILATKEHKQMSEQTTKVVTGGKRVNNSKIFTVVYYTQLHCNEENRFPIDTIVETFRDSWLDARPCGLQLTSNNGHQTWEDQNEETQEVRKGR